MKAVKEDFGSPCRMVQYTYKHAAEGSQKKCNVLPEQD